jgi:ribose transport system substrate-binding protein
MKSIKLLCVVLVVVMVVSLFAACSTKSIVETAEEVEAAVEEAGEAVEEEVEAEREGIKVGISVLDIGNTLYSSVVNGVKSVFDESIDTITIIDCQNNAAKQAEQVENLANAGYDGIIILPADAVALSDACAYAQSKGTRIITWVTKLENQDAHINADPYTFGGILGKATGEWIAEHWPDQEVVEVGMLTYNSIPEVITRQEGMVGEMLKYAPNAKVVAEKDAASPEEGLAVAESFLQAYPDMKVIMGINDGGAIGAFEAVLAMGKDTDDYFVGGCDGIQQALEMLTEDSIYRCTVSIQPFKIGAQTAQNLKDMVEGNDFWTETEYEIALVTWENVGEFIE